MVATFRGSPAEIGRSYGETFRGKILSNIDTLLTPIREELTLKPGFPAWRDKQEADIAVQMPWYKQEMQAVSEAVGVDYETILLLNLRAWQYDLYSGASPDEHCSSVIIRLADGCDVNAGALDDPYELYCGPVRIVPDEGYSFISFPITGTGWGNRGMNSAGLTIGISSQRLGGLHGRETMCNQDIAIRAILQTCATVEEVREYCRMHSFTLNLVVSDAQGGRLCMHNTVAGPLELPEGEYAAMTNHVVCDQFFRFFVEHGVRDFPESTTTRKRRSRLVNLIEEREGKADFEEILSFLCKRYPDEEGSIWNDRTIVLTAACPMKDRNGLWLLYPTLNGRFERFDVQI